MRLLLINVLFFVGGIIAGIFINKLFYKRKTLNEISDEICGNPQFYRNTSQRNPGKGKPKFRN